MPAGSQLDRVHHFILSTLVAGGEAPDPGAIARALGVEPDEGRRLLHQLMASGLPMWLEPGTDRIASFAPFSIVPTPYLLGVNGQQRWFGQCGIESLAAGWLFPDQALHLEARGPGGGEPLRIVLRNGSIEHADPAGIVLYVDLPISRWARDWPFT